jgi:hypothetical protein
MYKEVLPRSRKVVSYLRQGRSWSELLGSAMADTAVMPSLLVLDGPSPLLGGTPHFHCYLMHKIVRQAFLDERIVPAIEEAVFADSLQTPWGTLGLLSNANMMWLYPSQRHRPLLDAALRFWDELYAEGGRYSNGSTSGQDLWSLNTNLKFVLANLGIETSTLNAPLPTGGLRALVANLRA